MAWLDMDVAARKGRGAHGRGGIDMPRDNSVFALTARLFGRGAELLVDSLAKIERGAILAFRSRRAARGA